MRPRNEPIEKVWFDERPVKDYPVLRILAVGLVVGLVIFVIGYCMDGTL